MKISSVLCSAATVIFGVLSAGDPVAQQLYDFNKSHFQEESTGIQTRYGVPVTDISTSLTAGRNGPMLLQDLAFFDTMAHFARERIPDRVVHNKGSGAFGYFEVTNDITKYTKAKLFEALGKKTKIAVRFSLPGPVRGTSETTRGIIGFAIKFYTEDGTWDLAGYNVPNFFIRDPMLFPMISHVFDSNPVTNVHDPNALWDFITLRPETVYVQMFRYSDNGTTDGYRHMNGFGQHAFKMVNDKQEAVYVKFHFPTESGVRNLTPERAADLRATDPDYATRDLYNAIERKEYPSWGFYIQVMTFEEASTFRWNPFDLTKIWPVDEFPLVEVGRFVLNENPTNFFADVEQLAFCPAHLVPGIEPSPDKMLQARLFAYSDTQRYRLGANHLQLPVNRPFGKHGVTNYQRDGPQTFFNQGGAPNYYPNSFGGPLNDPRAAASKFWVSGDVERYNSTNEDNFTQPGMYWTSLTTEEQDRMVQNLVAALKNIYPVLQKRAVDMFKNVNATLAQRLEENLKFD